MRPVTSGQRHSAQMLCLALWILGLSNVCHGRDLRLDDNQVVELPEEQSDSNSQSWLGEVSSIEELLEHLYPRYSQVQHCFRRKVVSPPAQRRDKVGRAPREATESQADGAIKAVIEEMRRTMCQPREVFLEVSKEYPEATNRLYMPSCVSVHRCGGCCHDESRLCTNTSYTFINKTLVEVMPVQRDKSVITVQFINHTACECQFKSPLHMLTKRSAPGDRLVRCGPRHAPCESGMAWDPSECKCMPEDMSVQSAKETALEGMMLAFCGPKKVLKSENCECVCQNGLTQEHCGPGQALNEDSCQCTARGQPTSEHSPKNSAGTRRGMPTLAKHIPLSARPLPQKSALFHAEIKVHRPVH